MDPASGQEKEPLVAGKQQHGRKVGWVTKPYRVFDSITTKTVDAIGGGGTPVPVPDLNHQQVAKALGIGGGLVFAHGKQQQRTKKSH
jgi:hypothetical protein